jgi:hypothetical protein
MLKNQPILGAFIVLAISGVVIYFGKLTLDKWDAGAWALMALGVAATLFFFAILVSAVKKLGEPEDKIMH